MFYEISREVFKQRINAPGNFVIVDMSKKSSEIASQHISYSEKFVEDFTAKNDDKLANVLLFTLDSDDSSPKVAGQKLNDLGYEFVYYYRGDAKLDELIATKS